VPLGRERDSNLSAPWTSKEWASPLTCFRHSGKGDVRTETAFVDSLRPNSHPALSGTRTILAPRDTGTPRYSEVPSVTPFWLLRALTCAFRPPLQGEGRGFGSLSPTRKSEDQPAREPAADVRSISG
jgi:hypothetical protein